MFDDYRLIKFLTRKFLYNFNPSTLLWEKGRIRKAQKHTGLTDPEHCSEHILKIQIFNKVL
jgi:hypothetical protein